MYCTSKSLFSDTCILSNMVYFNHTCISHLVEEQHEIDDKG